MKEAIKKLLSPSSMAFFAFAVLFFNLMPTGSAAMRLDHDNNQISEIAGPIISLPDTAGWIGDWKIFRITVKVTEATKIDQTRGRVAVGALVEIKGTKQNDGSFLAAEIVVKLGPGSGLPIKFTGKIEELPSTPGRVGDWKINRKTVHVTAATMIDQEKGQIGVGVFVEVEGLVQTDGSINALEIEVKPDGISGIPVKFLGKVEKLPSTEGRLGEWVISGRTVKINDRTIVETGQREIMVGSLVEVEGIVQLDGSINASKIVLKSDIDPPTLYVNFRGKIEVLPPSTSNIPNFIGDWKVSGRTVRVTDKTAISEEHGKVTVGALVEVSGTLLEGGVVNALKIAVREDNRPNMIRFSGIVATLPPSNGIVPGFIGEWKVSDRIVHVSPSTKVDEENGRVMIGALVEVEGTLRDDRSIDAIKIEVKHSFPGGPPSYVRFYGELTRLPDASIQIGNGRAGDWTVGGKTVHVVPRTPINQEHGRLVIGAFLEVEGSQRADGSIDAFQIEVERDANAPDNAIGYINFYGPIRTLPSAAGYVGLWVIDGKMVNVTDTTKLEKGRGDFAIGAYVEVKGYLLDDDTVTAIKIEGRAPARNTDVVRRSLIEFIGKVEALPESTNYVGDWVVAGKTVHVRRNTPIRRERAAVTVGATVEIYGAELPDGSVDARFIEVEHGPANSSFVAFAPLTSVNAGSYLTGAASSAIIASFGSNLASGVEIARDQPLPTELGGVSVLVDGRPAGLFFVSGTQINYLAPDDLLPGAAQVTVLRNGQVVAQGALELGNINPSVFTADSSGQGAPAGLLLRVKANGQQSYEPLAKYENGKVIPVTITRNAGDKLYLVLYGTGWRGGDDTDNNSANGVAENLEVTIGNAKASVLFAGAAPGYAGLDQMNVEIPANITGTVTILVKVNDGDGNVGRTNSVTISIR